MEASLLRNTSSCHWQTHKCVLTGEVEQSECLEASNKQPCRREDRTSPASTTKSSSTPPVLLRMILGRDSTFSAEGRKIALFGIHTNMSAYSEAWRYTGPFSRWNRFKGIFPGFWIGAGAFGVYMVYEQLFMSSGHGHGEGHEEGHH